MRYIFLLLLFFAQFNASGYNIHNPMKNHAEKTLTSENTDLNEWSYQLFRYYSPDEGMYISQDPIGLLGGQNLYAYVHDTNMWVDVLGLAGTGGAYMFGFGDGSMYIGKGEIGRMNESISIRQGNSPLIGKAHVSTGGNNELGKMVEYKAMKNAGFTRDFIPENYQNTYLSGETAWNNPKNKHLQGQASDLADKLRTDYEADVQARKKIKGGCG